MTVKRLGLIGGGIVLMPLPLFLFLFAGRDAARPRVMGLDENTTSSEKRGPLEFTRYNFRRGKVYKYDFQRSMRIHMPRRPEFEIAMTGALHVHALSAAAGRLNLLLIIKPYETKGLFASKSKDARVYRVFLRVDNRGRPLSVRMAPDENETAAHIIRDVVSNFLQVLPREGSRPLPREKTIFDFFGSTNNSRTYAITGRDPRGVFRARLNMQYEDDAPRGNALFKQLKTEYTSGRAPIQIESSQREVRWSPAAGGPRVILGHETLRMGPDQFKIKTRQTYNYELTEVSDSRREMSEAVFLSRVIKIFESKPAAPRAKEYKAQTWKEIAAGLESVPDATKAGKQSVFLGLAKSLRANPRLALAVRKAAEGYPSSDERYGMLVGALGYAGQREAQRALVSLYDHSNTDARGRQNILQAFTLMEKPATKESIRRISREFKTGDHPHLRNSAGLALGSILGTTGDKEIHKLILDKWLIARNSRERLNVMEMIGNSGDARFLPVIQQAMAMGPNLLRRKAVYALRYVHNRKARTMLIDTLLTDKRKELRMAAARALAMHPRPGEFMDALRNCVRRETSDALRMACADVGLAAGPKSEQMRKLLREIKNSRAEISANLEQFIDVRSRRTEPQ